jgi:hypothetical protein
MGWWERVKDGTCSQVVSVEYRGQDTNTQEEAGINKHFFIDVDVRNRIWWKDEGVGCRFSTIAIGLPGFEGGAC